MPRFWVERRNAPGVKFIIRDGGLYGDASTQFRQPSGVIATVQPLSIVASSR